MPLSFENNLKPPRDVTVRVHLESAKLLFPKGADQSVTLKPGSNTIRFTVEARASGTFPMKISVTSPNGRLQFGAPVLVTVRSAVFGGWAVGVTVVALLFLAGWWANHFRRTRPQPAARLPTRTRARRPSTGRPLARDHVSGDTSATLDDPDRGRAGLARSSAAVAAAARCCRG